MKGKKLCVQGLLDGGGERQAGSSARHRAFLRHLHPQLHLPTLAPPQPSSCPPRKQAPKISRTTSMASAESGLPSSGQVQEKTAVGGAAEAAPVIQHQMSSESISESSAAPNLGLHRRSKSQAVSGGTAHGFPVL